DLRARLGEDLLAVALFGSVARGVGHATSDIDLLVVHRLSARDPLKLFVDAVLALRRTPEYRTLEAEGFLPEPAPIFLTPERLSEHPRVLLDVLDHGVVLHDPQRLLDETLKRLRQRLDVLGAKKVTLEDGTWYWDLKPDWKPGDIITL
ncbi:MAG: nucleotidyltransferase domain-containing protein, partial [Candidatus Rokuibacteriota bacterium]